MKNKNYIIVFLSFFLVIFLLLGIAIFKSSGHDGYGSRPDGISNFEKKIEEFEELKKKFKQIKGISGTDSNTFEFSKISCCSSERDKLSNYSIINIYQKINLIEKKINVLNVEDLKKNKQKAKRKKSNDFSFSSVNKIVTEENLDELIEDLDKFINLFDIFLKDFFILSMKNIRESMLFLKKKIEKLESFDFNSCPKEQREDLKKNKIRERLEKELKDLENQNQIFVEEFKLEKIKFLFNENYISKFVDTILKNADYTKKQKLKDIFVNLTKIFYDHKTEVSNLIKKINKICDKIIE